MLLAVSAETVWGSGFLYLEIRLAGIQKLISLFSSAVDNVKECRENTSIDIGVKMGDDKGLTPRTMVEQGSNQFGDIRAWNSQVNQGNFYNTVFSQSSRH